MRPRFSHEPDTLGRLKWTFLLTLVVLFVFVEFGRYNLFPYLDTLGGRLLMDLVITRDNRHLAIDLVGFPGEFEEAIIRCWVVPARACLPCLIPSGPPIPRHVYRP